MSIFDSLIPCSPDPLFDLSRRAQQDRSSEKVDLTIGVYRNEKLQINKMRAVREGEKRLLSQEKNATYLPQSGEPTFLQRVKELLFGSHRLESMGESLLAIQTLGGTGGLRVSGEFISQHLTREVWAPSPTWPNHRGIFTACGMNFSEYPYYSATEHTLLFEQMLDSLSRAKENSVVILHPCCHNPSGCDLSQGQWGELSALMLEKKLFPLFDFAYAGFAKGVEEDMWPIRYFEQQGHEFFIVLSFSKSFGLYGERVGALVAIAKRSTSVLSTIIQRLIRTSYSTPPRHGAEVISLILSDLSLTSSWKEELEEMRGRIGSMRRQLSQRLNETLGGERFAFLKHRLGMFALLPFSRAQVERLISQFNLYLTYEGRINLSGLNEKNLPYVVRSISQVCGSSIS